MTYEAREVLVTALHTAHRLALRVGGKDEELADVLAGYEAAIALGVAIRHNGLVTAMPEDPEPEPEVARPKVADEPTVLHVLEALEEIRADAKRLGYDKGQRALLSQAIKKLDTLLNETEEM